VTKPLLTGNIDDFLDRFNRFHDAVIREIHIVFGYRSQHRDAGVIILSVQDQQCPQNKGWVNVNLQFVNVREFSMTHSAEEYHQVISDEIHIQHLNGLFFVDLGASIDQPNTIDQFKKSRFYLACESIQWNVVAYTE